ncbi:Small-conductance mechanosensitive channel [Pseudidiomarina planktonica]|uniref:Small-conductance mechanosensitive channel n=1 Tax=Pseudidiomarina planktonica TaxID=1323738 RepID=A0A1Y6EXL0_9GAMM|nr:mechanosensitive ion channel domain-containing protein [Pseudidiomarina planktonica]RUO65435.1 hypothetical protein CWI77_02965 [Pseudidiomarina planktonica]SMQ65013.1 Small-conductance mechanosensitive channel [Pseudidiomarina planktonica]
MGILGSFQEYFNVLVERVSLSESMLRLLISSLILFTALLILRWIIRRFIRRTVKSVELRQRWLRQTRNAILLLLVLGLVLIWGNELRTLALSLVAIAVALVVATKELILCVTGTIVKNGANSFNLGDRIQVKDFRGDVIAQNMLATTILEVGPGKLTHQRTGRMIVVPNALFVSEPVINESYTHDYVLHVFTVPFKREENWRAAQQALLQATNEHCAPYLENVRAHMKRESQSRGLTSPSVEPRVSLQVPNAGEIHLIVRIPTKSENRSAIEQSILTDVFTNNDFSVKKDSGTEEKGIEKTNADNPDT